MTESESKTPDATRRFVWAVQALAAPASEQVRLFPDFSEVTDELALIHEETQANFLKEVQPSLSTRQRKALERLDARLEEMSGSGNPHFWTTDALETAPEWQLVRDLAATVLREMAWPLHTPAEEADAIYVGPPVD